MQLKLPVLPEGLQVFWGERWLSTFCYIPEWPYNKTHLLYALRPVLYTSSNGTPWTVVPGMHRTHCKHNPLVLLSVSNNNLSLLIYRCMSMEHTPIHILKYMSQTSNNNKILINNSSCYFAIPVLYTHITVKWGIRYIDEGFLVWIIPSMYLSHEAVIWGCTTSFACIWYYRFYRFLSVLRGFFNLGGNSGYINSWYGDVRYRVYIYEGFLDWITRSTY